MDQPQTPNTDISVINDLQTVVNDVKKLYPIMTAKAEATKQLLSGLTTIANDEQDEKAKTIIINAREVHDVIQEKRKQITAPLDRLKEILMGPEKSISTDPKALDSPYTLARQLRDRFATIKEANAAKERAAIAAKLAKENEITRIAGEIEKNIATGVITAVQASEKAIAAYWETINLENYEQASKRMGNTPVLKQEIYDAWFYTPYDRALVPDIDFGGIVLKKKEEHPFDAKSAEFTSTIMPTMEAYRGRLPEKKLQMEAKAATDLAAKVAADAAAQAAADAAAATNEKQRKAAADAAQAAKKAADDAQAAAELAAKQKADDDAKAAADAATRAAELATQQASITEQAATDISQGQLKNTFQSQIASQQVEDAEGVKRSRQATIVCVEEEMIQVLSELMYLCLSHPDYPGIIQKDKKGNFKHDEQMRPIYVPWLESMLTFAAANCPEIDDMPGIQMKDIVKTIQKA